jgi:hypothetical protein
MKFHELKVGDKFVLDNIEHERITDERVSCCKVLNAINKSTNEKIMVVPITEVNVVENS